MFFTTVIHIKQSRTQGNVTHFSEHQSLLSTGKKRYGEFVRKKKQQTSEFKGKKYKPKQQNYEIPPNPFYMDTHFVFRNIQTDTQH